MHNGVILPCLPHHVPEAIDAHDMRRISLDPLLCFPGSLLGIIVHTSRCVCVCLPCAGAMLIFSVAFQCLTDSLFGNRLRETERTVRGWHGRQDRVVENLVDVLSRNAILYCTILYYTIPYCTLLYYTIL